MTLYSPTLERTINGWIPIADTVAVPHTEDDYNRLVAMVDELIDTVGEDEDHPLASLMETLGTLIEAYEDEHVPEPVGDPLATLRFLMSEHALTVDDLPELGNAHDVEKVLAGHTPLTLPQIRALATRFGVAPAVFV